MGMPAVPTVTVVRYVLQVSAEQSGYGKISNFLNQTPDLLCLMHH